MSRKPTGELIESRKGFAARIVVSAARRRKCFALAVANKNAAVERMQAMAAMSSRLRDAGHEGDVVRVMRLAAAARSSRAFAAVAAAVDALCAGSTEATDAAQTTTFAEFATDWIEGRLHARFPDHVPKKDSQRD